ncbi:dynein beta chain, ciliary-like, partial [Actinia tenebrosa]|uniref:Dynein beta chain, ciliary-like n=1 Tax=Actinia tenebrosa TaxID=6105 RepID=A0A6P8I6R6_ACTTE
MEFSKLEKVEIAGIKGKVLSHQVVEIFNEFNELYAMFGNRTYDGLDATNKEFVDDYNQFRERITDLDRRLASIVCQAFDDCPSTESALK